MKEVVYELTAEELSFQAKLKETLQSLTKREDVEAAINTAIEILENHTSNPLIGAGAGRIAYIIDGAMPTGTLSNMELSPAEMRVLSSFQSDIEQSIPVTNETMNFSLNDTIEELNAIDNDSAADFFINSSIATTTFVETSLHEFDVLNGVEGSVHGYDVTAMYKSHLRTQGLIGITATLTAAALVTAVIATVKKMKKKRNKVIKQQDNIIPTLDDSWPTNENEMTL